MEEKRRKNTEYAELFVRLVVTFAHAQPFVVK